MSAGKRLAVAGMLGFAFAAAPTVSASAQAPPPCNAPFYGGACPGAGVAAGGSGGASAPTGASGGNLVAASVGGGVATPVAPSVSPGGAAGGSANALAGGSSSAAGGGTLGGDGGGTAGVGGGVLSVAGSGAADSLAFTGSATGPMVGVASLCLALGCSLLLLSSRGAPVAVAARATEPMSAGSDAPAATVTHARIRPPVPQKGWWQPPAPALAALTGRARVRLEALLGRPSGSLPGSLNARPGLLGFALTAASTGPPLTGAFQVRRQQAVVFSGRSRPR